MQGVSSSKKKKGKNMAALSVGAVAAAVAHLEGPSHVLGAPATVLRSFISTLLPPAPAASTAPGEGGGQAAAPGHISSDKKAGKNKAGKDGGDAQAQQAGEQQGLSDDGVQMPEGGDAGMLSFEVPDALDLFASD